MTLRRRLQKLEQTLPGPDPLADDPEYQFWRLFYEGALGVLTLFPEARKKVEQNMGIQEPCIFRPDWQPAASGADLRFYFCKESLWAALEKFPQARQALDDFLVAAFSEEIATSENTADKQPSAET